MPQTNPVAGYGLLGDAAERERQALSQRSAERQNAVIGGYDQQIQNNRLLGDQGYATLAQNYDAISADANSTRSRNMARVDQYGNSARSDLNVRARQAMATASQSAIKRGLGNTTVANSLQRGAAFDNTRQQLALEDQLLQNRISTDMNLSAAYQGSLNTRATGLNQQFNQNMNNENSLTSQRLGYIGGIQEDMSGFNGVANLYAQQYGMQNQNEQNTLERDARTLEANTGRAFQAGETRLERDARTLEANTGRAFQAGETRLERDARLQEANTGRVFQAGQSELDRSLQREQTDKQIGTQISQAALDRAFQGDQSLLQREAQKQEADINRVWQAQQAQQDQLFKGKESAAERASRHEEAELDRKWQQRQAEQERNTKIEEAAKDRALQERESSKQQQATAYEGERDRLAQSQGEHYGQTKVANPNLGRTKYGGYTPAYIWV
jgi:hypothetical protein